MGACGRLFTISAVTSAGNERKCAQSFGSGYQPQDRILHSKAAFCVRIRFFIFHWSVHTCRRDVSSKSPLLHRWGRSNGNHIWSQSVVLKLRTNQISIATQKTNISSSLFHNVPGMARSAASQPLLLAGPLDAGPLRAPAIRRPRSRDAKGSDSRRG